MKLSEAIRLGAMLAPQGFGLYKNPNTGATCALGAALEAVSMPAHEGVATIRWGWASEQRECCPSPWCWLADCLTLYTSDRSVIAMITHLNDRHKWTRERIADWVATVEPQVQLHDAARIERLRRVCAEITDTTEAWDLTI